ncbi:MAG: hypothetical protein P4M08_10990 [Oligoflexia bacterium]|nr:hypothetical protein [Oligoflexia bacterium]
MKQIQNFAFLVALLCVAATGAFAQGQCKPVHFVPDSQEFWDYSKHWTTNYGPAYRDTNEALSNFLPCTGSYALCFNSGPEPLPCTLDKTGRFANCKCTIESGLQFVTINSILNYDVYLETVSVCGMDGSGCATQVDKAPVCRYIQQGKLIPGAEIISDFSPQVRTSQSEAMAAHSGASGITQCPKAPYAGCMTAPCRIENGYAECSCPVFWGPFQLTQPNAECELGNDLIWSASYSPN